MTRRALEVVRVAVLECHRCGGSLLFSVDVPHSFRRTDGTEVPGTRTVGLCERCDRDTPPGRGLIAFFTVNPVGRDEHGAEIEALLTEWIDSIPSVAAVGDDPDETEHAWRAGEV